MNRQRREFFGGVATIGAASLLLADPAMAQSAKPDVAVLIKQFHTNYNNNELDKSRSMVVDEVIADINGGAGNGVNGFTFRGREEFIAWLKNDKIMFPSNKLVHQAIVADGNHGAVRFYMEGVHRGAIKTPQGVLRGTGRKVHLEVTEFATFNDDGKLVHVHTLYNTQGLLMQLRGKA